MSKTQFAAEEGRRRLIRRAADWQDLFESTLGFMSKARSLSGEHQDFQLKLSEEACAELVEIMHLMTGR